MCLGIFYNLFNERFSDHIPSLIECESLTIQGDVRFEANVSIKGRVLIKNNRNQPAIVKAGTVIEDSLTFD